MQIGKEIVSHRVGALPLPRRRYSYIDEATRGTSAPEWRGERDTHSHRIKG